MPFGMISLTWGAPALLPLLALAAVPVLLHLFARARPPVLRFSSVEFLRQVLRTQTRLKRPYDWMLLVLRTLLFLAVLLLFLRPRMFPDAAFAGAGGRKDVVLVVDATASMACKEGAQTRFAAACAGAAEILSGLAPGDRANVIWLRARPTAVFPAPGVNLSWLQDELRKAGVSQEAGDIPGALALAGRMLAGNGPEPAAGRREIIILSDFQASAWAGAPVVPPPGTTLMQVKIGRETAPNTAVTRITVEPGRPLAGETATVFCEIRHFAPTPRQAKLFFNPDEGRQVREVSLDAWGRATVAFQHKFATAGDVPVTVSLEEDGFPMDDRAFAVVPVRSELQAGLLGLDPSTARAWSRALEATGWTRVEALAPESLAAPPPLDLMLLAGWDGATGRAGVAGFLRQGGAVLWLPAAGDGLTEGIAELAAAAGTSGKPARAPQNAGGVREERGGPWRIRATAPDAPAFRIFAAGAAGDPTRAHFGRRCTLAADRLPPDGTPLLTFADNVPALVQWRGAGTLLLWNLPLDEKTCNWPQQNEFLPFLAELVLTARSPAAAATRPAEPGQPLRWQPDRTHAGVPAASMSVRTPQGETLPVTEDTSGRTGARTLCAPAMAAPGIVTWMYGDQPAGCSVVNFPESESDLRTLDLDRIRKRQAGAAAADGAIPVRDLREGIPLWPWLLLAAGLCAAGEAAVLLRAQRGREETGPGGEGRAGA